MHDAKNMVSTALSLIFSPLAIAPLGFAMVLCSGTFACLGSHPGLAKWHGCKC